MNIWKSCLKFATVITVAIHSLPAFGASVTTDWVEAALESVKHNHNNTYLTVASLVYGLLGTVMYDAWSAYEETSAIAN